MTPPSEKDVEERARQLAHGGEGHKGLEGEGKAAENAARLILEESEARAEEAATTDPENDDVIRRTSKDTA